MTKPVHVKPKRPKKAYAPPFEFVEVVWDDAASNSDHWVKVADVAVPEQVITRGWLVKETAKYVAIASSVPNEEDDDQVVGNTMTIPVGMIVSRRAIKVVTAKEKKPRKARFSDGVQPKGEGIVMVEKNRALDQLPEGS